MPRYRIEPIDESDSIWLEYDCEILVVEADNEQQARFLAANRMAGQKLAANKGTAMPLPPPLVKKQTRCISLK
ncbi:MAG: hypothetical protein B0D91_00795 [Oceanospirillales bacterium LUC14_002_19_P2]|nr:MAG: hypothetical protein B0D91_00795 [Oceanospirillales bacterium LUC14_002_19_P2]